MSLEKVNDLHIVRALPAVELRADDSGDLGVLSGHFAKFDVWYRVSSIWEGTFLERVQRGAFKKTMRENRQGMRVLYDHGMDPQIGNKVLGSIRDLREDDDGAYYEVDLFDTSYNRDLEPGLRAGAYGASFRFQVVKDSWDHTPARGDHNPEGLPERTIKETRTFEFGPVTFPASPSATAVMRCMTDEYYQRLRTRDASAVEELLAEVRALRTPPTPAELTFNLLTASEVREHEGLPTGDTGAAPHDTNEPAAGHSIGRTPGARRGHLKTDLSEKEKPR